MAKQDQQTTDDLAAIEEAERERLWLDSVTPEWALIAYPASPDAQKRAS